MSKMCANRCEKEFPDSDIFCYNCGNKLVDSGKPNSDGYQLSDDLHSFRAHTNKGFEGAFKDEANKNMGRKCSSHCNYKGNLYNKAKFCHKCGEKQ